jgi:IS4 transposase
LDLVKYPAEDIKEIYLKRWNVELYFRDLKTTLGMDILRCKSPDMVEKEILMNFIVFNMLKRLSYDSIKESDSDPDDVRF